MTSPEASQLDLLDIIAAFYAANPDPSTEAEPEPEAEIDNALV
jgi:hypothetical protein